MKNYDNQLERHPDDLILGVDYDELDDDPEGCGVPTLWLPELGGGSPYYWGQNIINPTPEDYKEAARRWAVWEGETTACEQWLLRKNSNPSQRRS